VSPAFTPGLGEHVGKPRHAFVERGVVVTHRVAIDDFTVLFITAARQQQAFDQQRVWMGIRGGGNDAGLQHGLTCSGLLLEAMKMKRNLSADGTLPNSNP